MRVPLDMSAGVFETLLVRTGRPVELDAHLARIDASLRALIGRPLPEAALELVLDHAAGIELGRLRLDAAAGVDGQPACSVRVAPVEEGMVFPAWRRAVRLRRLVVPGGLGPHKWADRRRVEAAEADRRTVPLVVDSDGAVLEASRGSMFLVREGVLVTPPLDGRILPGVTRRRVLELAVEAGVAVREAPVTAADLDTASEVFLTGAVRGVEPVRDYDGGTRWSEGPMTTLIAARLRRLWERVPVEEGSPWR